MKAGEVRKFNDQELRERLEGQHKRLFELRSQAETEKLEKPSEVTKAKREIARLMTIIGERSRGAQPTA